ncbi:MAG: GntR family transcriptional regulator [Desulfitobacteriaceae bacterium]
MDSYNGPLQVKTKTEAVYTMLKEAIISGEISPGERIVLRKLAQNLGVSGIPIREAVKQLESEGLVTILPHSEITVAKLSPKEFQDLFQIRIVLESYAVGLVAQGQTQEIVSILNKYLEEMEKGVDPRTYGMVNKQFHDSLNGACGNEELYKMIMGLANRTERARGLFAMDPKRMRESYQEHLEIVDAIKRANPADAEAAVKRHKERALEFFLRASIQRQLEVEVK